MKKVTISNSVKIYLFLILLLLALSCEEQPKEQETIQDRESGETLRGETVEGWQRKTEVIGDNRAQERREEGRGSLHFDSKK